MPLLLLSCLFSHNHFPSCFPGACRIFFRCNSTRLSISFFPRLLLPLHRHLGTRVTLSPHFLVLPVLLRFFLIVVFSSETRLPVFHQRDRLAVAAFSGPEKGKPQPFIFFRPSRSFVVLGLVDNAPPADTTSNPPLHCWLSKNLEVVFLSCLCFWFRARFSPFSPSH